MELLMLVVGVIGNAISIMVFLAPLPTFFSIVKRRDTKSFSAVPYIVCLFSQMLWLYYGVLNPKGLLLVTISSVGCGFETSYLIIYLVFATKPQKVYNFKLLGISLLSFLCIFLSTLFGAKGHKRLTIVGLLGCINSICMYAAPLGVMKQVIATRSVEFMPFFLSFSLFLCGGIWSAYALIVKDLFIGVPNGIGLLLGTIQLVLYLMFFDRKPKQAKLESPFPNNFNSKGITTFLVVVDQTSS
ncbi:hypothetical protein GOP47_0014964 [Adiantum capillus-veneris]|uniref:Bidirectional sugar transporter SWEET n=1 Tax=Adiantum capillus-veneris TaxID=13818 RepID=A0A9D4UN68_ADICA|nr:hypothetical protein GOP47_0014964 [Adiantum capillus-veneris]